MKASKFIEDQIVYALRQVEGRSPVADVVRNHDAVEPLADAVGEAALQEHREVWTVESDAVIEFAQDRAIAVRVFIRDGPDVVDVRCDFGTGGRDVDLTTAVCSRELCSRNLPARTRGRR
jgi:hypothetical protein